MKISQEDAILIKHLYLSKQYGARRLLSGLPDNGWKLEGIDSLLKRSHTATRRVQLSGNHTAVDRVRRVAVEDLVLSQEDKQKRHRSAREISHETAILRSNVHTIIHHASLAPVLQTTLCSSDCLKPITSPVSLADKQPCHMQ